MGQFSYKDIRRKLGKTQKEMAEILGISRSYYGLIENYNRPMKINLFMKMCKLSNINPYDVKINL